MGTYGMCLYEIIASANDSCIVWKANKNTHTPQTLEYDNSVTQNSLLTTFSFSPKDNLSLQIKPLCVHELTVWLFHQCQK